MGLVSVVAVKIWTAKSLHYNVAKINKFTFFTVFFTFFVRWTLDLVCKAVLSVNWPRAISIDASTCMVLPSRCRSAIVSLPVLWWWIIRVEIADA